MPKGIYPRPSLVERFILKVQFGNDCWLWTGTRMTNGYGVILDNGKPVLAHRASYGLFRGAVPADMFVCHHCDNPPCVRLDHLSLGTQQDNMRDTVSRGRHVRGDRVGTAKLTEAAVLEILQRYGTGGVTQKALAAEFGVRQSQIQAIVNGRAWKHVQLRH